MSLSFKVPDEVTIYAFDPGKDTGIAIWKDGKLHQMAEVNVDNIFEWLQTVCPEPGTVVIIEDYKIRPSKANAHIWNNLTAANLIGAIEFWAHTHHCNYLRQQPAIKPVGYGRMKRKAGKGKGNHQWDAVAHLIYYLMRNYDS